MPVEFLTDAQAATYGHYMGPLSAAELDRFFLLDDKARGLIEPKRLPHTRLGYAVQLTTLLFLGTFLPDPTDVPTEVVDYLAKQLDIGHPSSVNAYRVCEMTGSSMPWRSARPTGSSSSPAWPTSWLSGWPTAPGPR